MRYRTGLQIPLSGIYLVHHEEHRLPHEVTLLKDQRFPPCSKCTQAVQFELIMGVSDETLLPFRIVLNEIPVMEEKPKTATEGDDQAS